MGGFDGSFPRRGLAPWQAKRVVAYIEANVSRSFNVPDLAGSVQLSVSHFFRAFKASFGQTPHVYVKVRRIRYAQAIMLNTREPLAQVALDCGMSDQAHFTRVFRSVVGISPSLWRRQYMEPVTVPSTGSSARTGRSEWRRTKTGSRCSSVGR